MIFRTSFIKFVFLMVVSLPVGAAYITDKLVAGLYETAALDDNPVKALNSGTPLEVVDRKGDFIKVRTPDGTVGWVEAAYLTDEKPARSMLLELQAKNSTLKTQLDRLLEGKPLDCEIADSVNADSANCPAVDLQQLSDLQIKLDASTLALQEANAEVEQLQQQNQLLRSKHQQIADIMQLSVNTDKADSSTTQASKHSLSVLTNISPIALLLILMVLLLGAGIAGYMIMRMRVRRRFGSIVSL